MHAFQIPQNLPQNLTVYIADDHLLFLKTLSQLVDSFECVDNVKIANDGRELIKMMKKELPDVVIIDYEMPTMDGVDTCKYILNKFHDVKIIMLTMHDNEVLIYNAIELGIHAFLLKQADPQEVEAAIKGVVQNDFYYNFITVNALRHGVVRKQYKALTVKASDITVREKEVLILICEELTMKEIGERLYLSDKTVQNHRQSLLRKLRVKNTAGLVKKAIELGIYML